jgi:cytosine/adenosine deaminase-related metal-dependent hydrolase
LYRKFTADNIFTGETILPAGNVLIAGETGVIEGIIPLEEAGDDIEYYSGIISPGFINAHCHLELSHLKGLIPEKTGLVDFVFRIITERHFAEDQILAAIAIAEEEMMHNGIIAVGDICNNVLTIPQKKKQRLHYRNFIEVSGFVPAFAKERFDRSTVILSEYRSTLPHQRSTLAPHAPYSVSERLFELINDATANDIITIHNQETLPEEDFIKSRTGDFLRLYEKMGIDISFYNSSNKSSLQTWWPYLNKNQSIILVHNVTTLAEDIALTKLPAGPCGETQNSPQGPVGKLKTFFCLCPNANLYITNTLPNVNMLMDNNCTIVLGTDSLASNRQLNIVEEIKIMHQNFPVIPLQTMLQWATINGAKALQMDDVLGSFEKGKQPGIVLIEGLNQLQVNSSSSSTRIL